METIRDLLPILAEQIDANYSGNSDEDIHGTHQSRAQKIPLKQFSGGAEYAQAGDHQTFNTSVLIKLALEVALRNDLPTIIFSKKNSKVEVAYMLLAMAGNLSLEKLKKGQLADKDWQPLIEALTQLNDANIYIDDYPIDEASFFKEVSLVKLIHEELGIILIDDQHQLESFRNTLGTLGVGKNKIVFL